MNVCHRWRPQTSQTCSEILYWCSDSRTTETCSHTTAPLCFFTFLLPMTLILLSCYGLHSYPVLLYEGLLCCGVTEIHSLSLTCRKEVSVWCLNTHLWTQHTHEEWDWFLMSSVSHHVLCSRDEARLCLFCWTYSITMCSVNTRSAGCKRNDVIKSCVLFLIGVGSWIVWCQRTDKPNNGCSVHLKRRQLLTETCWYLRLRERTCQSCNTWPQVTDHQWPRQTWPPEDFVNSSADKTVFTRWMFMCCVRRVKQ